MGNTGCDFDITDVIPWLEHSLIHLLRLQIQDCTGIGRSRGYSCLPGIVAH